MWSVVLSCIVDVPCSQSVYTTFLPFEFQFEFQFELFECGESHHRSSIPSTVCFVDFRKGNFDSCRCESRLYFLPTRIRIPPHNNLLGLLFFVVVAVSYVISIETSTRCVSFRLVGQSVCYAMLCYAMLCFTVLSKSKQSNSTQLHS